MVTKRRQTRRSNRRLATQNTETDLKRRKFFQDYLYYMEGLADYSQVSSPYESVEKDHRTLGWNIGRQLVALYLVEMLLRIDFERRGITSGTATHNLASLFRQLPERKPEKRRKSLYMHTKQRS